MWPIEDEISNKSGHVKQQELIKRLTVMCNLTGSPAGPGSPASPGGPGNPCCSLKQLVLVYIPQFFL